jgi:hypothetical protein
MIAPPNANQYPAITAVQYYQLWEEFAKFMDKDSKMKEIKEQWEQRSLEQEDIIKGKVLRGIEIDLFLGPEEQ